MQLTMKKATFLANSMSKQRFINLLGRYLKEKWCKVYHARGDADLLIIQKAVELSSVMDTVQVGVNTDLFVCCAIMPTWTCTVYFSDQSLKKHQKSQSVGYQGFKRITGAGSLCWYSFYSCYAWIRYYFSPVWY